MYIFDRKEKTIDVYTIEPKLEEVKKYKKSVLKNYKEDNLFYTLKTNAIDYVLEYLKKEEADVYKFEFSHDSYFDSGSYSSLYQEDKKQENAKEQKEIIDKYIEGEYESLPVTRVFKYLSVRDIYYLLKTKEYQIKVFTTHGNINEIRHILNLPRSLYLLHLLSKGSYEKLVNEDIKKQLKLFDIELYKSLNISDIEDIISTGIITDTMENVINKAQTGSKILRKIK